MLKIKEESVMGGVLDTHTADRVVDNVVDGKELAGNYPPPPETRGWFLWTWSARAVMMR